MAKDGSEELTKLVVRGFVAEHGIEDEFESCLVEINDIYDRVCAKGEKSQSAFLMAVTYFMASVQQ